MVTSHNKYLIARLDGKNFSKLDIQKPFDDVFRIAMIESSKQLMIFADADVTYTQSDEVSLIWFPRKTEHIFGGKHFKIQSLLAAYLSTVFLEYNIGYRCIFDCRLLEEYSEQECMQYLSRRRGNAITNSVSMLASAYFSHHDLMNKNTESKLQMLATKNIHWEELHGHYKYGTIFTRTKELIKYSSSEIDKLPIKHNARTNPDLLIERSVMRQKEFTP
jgi:tRNA(His) guanylyltransferase